MQTAIATRTRAAAPPPRAKPISATPAIVIAKVEPHPVYGTTPIGRDGCTLEIQPIQMLNFWHERATTAAAEYSKSMAKARKQIEDDDAVYNLLYECRWDIFDAAFMTKAARPGCVDHLLRIVKRHLESFSATGDEVLMTVEQVNRLAAMACKAAEPAKPTKHVGALQRGRRLTRAGLLHRYHAFLIGELETLGWNMYGARDLPMQYRPNDHAVSKRCNGTSKHPFFDESKLTARARSVLKSLRIDTARNDDVPARKSSKRGSR